MTDGKRGTCGVCGDVHASVLADEGFQAPVPPFYLDLLAEAHRVNHPERGGVLSADELVTIVRAIHDAHRHFPATPRTFLAAIQAVAVETLRHIDAKCATGTATAMLSKFGPPIDGEWKLVDPATYEALDAEVKAWYIELGRGDAPETDNPLETAIDIIRQSRNPPC